MDKFTELSDDTIDTFNEIFNKKAMAVNIKFAFMGNSKQKKLIAISKIPDQYAFLMEKDLLVQINEVLMNAFDEKSIQILFEQEIDKLSVNIDTGKIKLVKPDLSTFSSLVTKYGIEDVSRANQVEILSVAQKEDKESDEFII